LTESLPPQTSQPPPPAGPPLSVPAALSPQPRPGFRRPAWGPGDSLLGVLAVAGMVIAGGLIVFPITGDSGLDAALAAQALLELALVGAAFWLARNRGERRPFFALGLRPPAAGWIKTAAAGYAIYFVAVLLILAVVGSPEQSDVSDDLGFDSSVLGAVVAATLIVVVAPFCEEIFFRGFFFAGLRSRLPFWAAGTISALLFGAVHLGEANWVAALQLMVLGLVLAAVYERTNSLWSNIAIHMFNNAIAFTLLVAS
jgi:membrane protease YdiL (CAAX protease family)